MTGPEVIDVARDSIMTLVLVSAPLMLVGLAVGVAISLFQALTQIQEMTLVFVPKILAIFIAMLIALPFMGDLLQSHMARLAARIAGGSRRRMRIDVSFLPAVAAGTMVMLLPGLGEVNIPQRVRLTVALMLTLVLFPLHRSAFTIDLRSFTPMLMLLGQELFVGLVLGLAARLTISALQVAGSIIAQ